MTTSDRTESTMYWHLQAFAVAVVLAAVAILGCSGDADADAGGPGDAGGDTVDTNDAIIQEICPGACSTIKTCYAELAPGVCEDQCAKEVTGTGYLAKEIALIVFETVRDAESDPSAASPKFLPGSRDALSVGEGAAGSLGTSQSGPRTG